MKKKLDFKISNFKRTDEFLPVKSNCIDSYLCNHVLAQEKFNDKIFDIGSTAGLPEYNGATYISTTNQEFQPLIYMYYSNDGIQRYLVSQDFILYYKLIDDIKDNKIVAYYKINENGEREDVIIIHNDCYQIKTSYIKDFLRVTNKSLLFDIEIDITYNENIEILIDEFKKIGINPTINYPYLNYRDILPID